MLVRFAYACFVGWMVVCGQAALVRGEVKLPAIFNDHMVLQQQDKAPVWGWADAGEVVSVTCGGQVQKTTADQSGTWRVVFQGLKPGSAMDLKITGKNEIVIHDVLVGEVWLCSGQSNMEFTLSRTNRGANAPVMNEKEEVAAADYPEIRMFYPLRGFADDPQKEFKDTNAKWMVCSPKTVGEFAAVAYFFGRDLHKALKTPVGLVALTVGGSTAEAWMSREALTGNSALRPIMEKYDNACKAFSPQVAKENDEAIKKWVTDKKQLQAEGKTVPPPPRRMVNPHTDSHSPTVLFNAMISPAISYGIRGAIWYQGESNTFRSKKEYEILMDTLIGEWRERWGQGDFPFYFVQLPNWAATPEGSAHQNLMAEMRDAQAQALAQPNTGMAVTIDVGDHKEGHPKNKQDVGHRLALIALSQTYHQSVEWSGPVFDSMNIQGQSVRIKFRYAEGLTAKGGKLEGFAVAGKDKKFVRADARIEGDSVIVSSPAAVEPVIVSYAWADSPIATLYNAAGLPARPFRTDHITPQK